MAQQVNLGTVQVTNGSATVRHEWKLLMTGVAGPGDFTVGATVGWTVPASGAGTIGAWDPVGKVLHVARTSGANPEAGSLITQTSPSFESGTVSSVAPTSPANWNAKLTLPVVATFNRHFKDYQVSSLAADSFVLVEPYLGASARNHEYGLNTDFTSLGLGLIRPGDVGATAIMTRSMTRLNTLLTRGAAAVRLATNLPLTNGIDATLSWDIEDEDTGGFITVPSSQFIVPAGIRRVDVGVAVRLTAGLSDATQVVTIRLLKNVTEIAQHSLFNRGVGVNLFRGALAMNAGETLSVKVSAATGSTLPSILAGTETNFWIRVAEVI